MIFVLRKTRKYVARNLSKTTFKYLIKPKFQLTIITPLFQIVCVEWNDAPIAGFINRYRGRVCRMQVEYTLEIVPNSEAPIKSKMYSDETSFIIRCLGPKKVIEEEAFKYKESFYGVEFAKNVPKEATK